MNKLKILTLPSVIGAVILTIMILTGGYLYATGNELPQELVEAFLITLAAVLGIQVPNEPIIKD